MITKSDITEHGLTTSTTRSKNRIQTFTFILIFGIHLVYGSHCSVTSFCHSTGITTKFQGSSQFILVLLFLAMGMYKKNKKLHDSKQILFLH